MAQFGAHTLNTLSRPVELFLLAGSVATAVVLVVAGPMTCLLLALSAALGLAAVRMPGVLLAAFILSGTYKAALQPYSPLDITLVLALLNAIQLVPLLRRRSGANVSISGIILLAAVGVLLLAGILYAPNQDAAVALTATYWAFVLLAILSAAMRVGSRPQYIRQFLWALFGLSIPMAVVGLTQLSNSERLVAFGASTIEVSRDALLVPLVGVIFVLQRRDVLVRAITLILIPTTILVAVATGSRGPLLALIILGAIGAIRYVSRPGWVNWRVAGVIGGVTLASVITVSLMGAVLPSLSLNRFGLFEDFLGQAAAGNLNTSAGDTSSSERVALFEVAASMFQERPVLGFGTGGFTTVVSKYLSPPYDEAYPHNAVLQFAAEFGVVGVVLFAGLVVLALIRPFARGDLGNAVRVVFVFYLLNAMVSDDIYSNRPFWGLLVLVLLIDVPKGAGEIQRASPARQPSDARSVPASATTRPQRTPS